MAKLLLFSGNSNIKLATKIARKLNQPISKSQINKFSDGEIQVNILENVRGTDTFIIQPTCAPTNDNLMELMLITDAIKRASAARITAVIPYFGYARQDCRIRSTRVPISAKLVAELLATAGIQRILTVDLHSEQIQGFFNIPVDNTYASQILIENIKSQKLSNLVIVSPDVGGVVRARHFAKRLGCDLAIIDKRRPKTNQAEVMQIIGNVENKNCILIDDLVDTGGTLCAAAKALKDNAANKVLAYATHPVLSGSAIRNIEKSVLDNLIITDTIPLSIIAERCNKIKQLSIAAMLAEAIKQIHLEESISCMFN